MKTMIILMMLASCTTRPDLPLKDDPHMHHDVIDVDAEKEATSAD